MGIFVFLGVLHLLGDAAEARSHVCGTCLPTAGSEGRCARETSSMSQYRRQARLITEAKEVAVFCCLNVPQMTGAWQWHLSMKVRSRYSVSERSRMLFQNVGFR